MPISSPSSPTIIPPQQSSAGTVKRAAASLNKTGGDDAQSWSTAAAAFGNIQQQIDSITRALQQPIPFPDPLQITAPDGSLIAEIGEIIDPTTNMGFSGIWGNNLYIGGSGPSTASIVAQGGTVTITNVDLTFSGPDGTIVISQGTPSITATDMSGDVATFQPALMEVASAVGNITINASGIVGSTASLATTYTLGMVPSGGDIGDGLLSVSNVAGTKSVGVNTGSGGSAVLTTQGGNVNVSGGVYEVGGVPGINATPLFFSAFATATNAVFGTPGVGQTNGPVVTGITALFPTFTGGILTAV